MFMYEKKRLKIVVNAPVIIWFSVVCTAALILSMVTNGLSNILVFSVYRSSLTDPLTYARFFCHVFGHANVSHLIGNLTMILVIGPMLEEKYGSKKILLVIAITAFVTGLINFIFFPGVALLGASGVVFAFILLASITGAKNKEIPLTFIMVAVLYLGEQVYEGVFVSDNVSQLTHIVGGVAGSVAGFRMRRSK